MFQKILFLVKSRLAQLKTNGLENSFNVLKLLSQSRYIVRFISSGDTIIPFMLYEPEGDIE